MAFVATPTTWVTGYAFANPNMTIPISAGAASQISTTEANATTGDIRQIFHGLCEMMYASYNGKAAADRPNRMTISKSASVDTSTGLTTLSFNMTFVCTSANVDVATEAV